MMLEKLPEDGSDGIAYDREPVLETPEPVIRYPSNWEDAATTKEAVEYESDLPWHSVPESQRVESPTFVFSKDEEDTRGYPVELQPAYTYQPPVSYEVPMYYKEDPEPIYLKGIDMMPDPLTYEEKYPIESPPWNPGPYDEPIPIVNGPIVTPTPVLPVDVPVTTPPPIINVNVGTQTPTTQNAVDGETALIFGYPWYYVAGAAAVGLLLFSSMDGKN